MPWEDYIKEELGANPSVQHTKLENYNAGAGKSIPNSSSANQETTKLQELTNIS